MITTALLEVKPAGPARLQLFTVIRRIAQVIQNDIGYEEC